ncbi:MAG: nucleotide-binding protein [Candidatus Woesearchaeota archaeon]|nr:nucleotide-binding protein [Candidatus Woesearchaeota archaeon]MDP7623209.1 nucleotide-binding protein [Candidatus Woesearchaeota archaeon]HJN56803.1 nucleotide-binding protein [Candidatus Woesearchaeota archaeon]
MQKILLDTNFLLIPVQFKVDIFSEIGRIIAFEFKLLVLDKTIEELKAIVENQKGKHKEAAKIALQLLKIKKVNIIKTESNKGTDDVIVDYAKNERCFVATQDKDLKRRLVNQGNSVIILKQKQKLAVINDRGFS